MSLLQTLRFSWLTFRLSRVPDWPMEHVARLREQRLRHLVSRAVARSPFYGQKYRGIDLDRIRLADLPICTKTEMVENFDRVVTDRRINLADVHHFMDDPANLGRYFLGSYGVSHTSGSQGQPLVVVQDKKALEILFAILTSRGSSFSKPGIVSGLRHPREPARIAIVSWKRGFYPSGAAFEFMQDVVKTYVRIARLSLTQVDLIDRLNEFQPHAIVGYSTVLESLAMQSRRLHLKPHLRQMSNTSEQLSNQARDRIQRTFGVPVLNHYATGECLFLSEGCPTDPGAHINADWAILEVVDENNRPVPDGEVGKKVLVTNLANEVQPFIRYEVGDMLKMAVTPCHCGNRMPRIEAIDGRTSDVFWVWDGAHYRGLNMPYFQTASEKLWHVREWQAIQFSHSRIEFLLVLLPEANFDEATAQEIVSRHMLESGVPSQIEIRVRLVAELGPNQKTGKLRRMVPLPVPTEIDNSRVFEPEAQARG